MWTPLPIRPAAPRAAGERRASLERLLAWAGASGASWDGIEFRVEADGGARAIATRPLAIGDVILTLPRHMMLVDSELGTGTFTHRRETQARDAIAAWLPLEVNAPTSPWKPYLDTLPAHVDLPMFRDRIDALDGTSAWSLAEDEAHDIRETYERLPPELRARLSLADFAWGRAIVASRAFHAPGTFEHRLALLPLVDILNHRTDDTGWSYSPYDSAMTVHMERVVETGDEVHFSYGNRSNSHLFVHYGFVLPDNASNEAHLVFEQPWPLRVRVRSDDFAEALSLARLQACDPEKRALMLAELPGSYVPYIDGATEAAALDVLATLARRACAELDAHAAPETSEWDRACNLVREGERAVLEQLLELATLAGVYATCTSSELQAAAETVGVQRMLRRYLQDLADEV